MEELFIPLRVPAERVEPLRSVRSTLISSSIQAIRGRGLFDAYLRELPREHHDTILSMVAGVWLPIEFGLAHYGALDRLIRSEAEQLDMGRDVANRVHRTILATLVRAARSAGVTPWTGIAAMPKLFERMFIGGGVAIYKLGPKDVRIEMVKVALLDNLYFRHAFCGVVASGLELFCRRTFVSELPRRSQLHAFKVQWAG